MRRCSLQCCVDIYRELQCSHVLVSFADPPRAPCSLYTCVLCGPPPELSALYILASFVDPGEFVVLVYTRALCALVWLIGCGMLTVCASEFPVLMSTGKGILDQLGERVMHHLLSRQLLRPASTPRCECQNGVLAGWVTVGSVLVWLDLRWFGHGFACRCVLMLAEAAWLTKARHLRRPATPVNENATYCLNANRLAICVSCRSSVPFDFAD
jgi:hypothetical protein